MDQEQQVWQRVAGELPELRGMELRCRESAAAFLQLSRSVGGAAREQLETLYRQERANAQTLRGMRVLSGEEPEPVCAHTAPRDSLRRGLAQAYRRSLQARVDYCTCARNGNAIFRDMETRELQTQSRILQLLGI